VSLGRKRKAGSVVVAASAVLGAAIGFATGIGWSTRHLTGEMARGARKSIGAARDARWLLKNPINYA
jgi:hypothetical protein